MKQDIDMNHIINAFKNLPRRGQHNFVKILCLALGLAISSVIIAEIYFEQTYDTYFPGWERTYQIMEVGHNKGEKLYFDQTSGATAHGIAQYAPIVEAATRVNWLKSNAQCKLENQQVFSADMVLADSCFFDVFPQGIFMGNAKETLSRPNYCLVSSRVAEKIGGNVVGKHFSVPNYPDIIFTIGGVFDAFPWNSTFTSYGVVVSMSTMPQVRTYDARNDWIGSDIFDSYIRIAKGHGVGELKPYVDKMRQDHFPMKELKQAGMELNYDFVVLSEVYTQNSYIKMMGWILGIIAFVLLFTSVMNYLLIIVGNLMTRSREMAVRKCYGAAPKNIHSVIFSEALVQVGLAVLLAALFIFLCKGTIRNFLSAPIEALMFCRGSWILVAICLFVLLVGGLVPGWLYSRIPVAVAFRGYQENRNRWKLALLGFQFVISGLLFSLLYVVSAQYHLMVNQDPGYSYENVAILKVDALDRERRVQCLEEIRRMPDVSMVSSTYTIPLDDWGIDGNTIALPGDETAQFNAQDIGGVDDNFFKMLEIPIIQGSFFTERNDSCSQIMIEEKMVGKLQKVFHWKDGVIGKRIEYSGDGKVYSICGVFRNIQIGSLTGQDSDLKSLPAFIFYEDKVAPYMLVKFKEMTDDTLEKLQKKVQAMYPNNLVNVYSYQSEMELQYVSQLHFRNGILVAGIVTMIIALFGLVGYTSDEVNRRRKEIAIRKVNGAKVQNILRIFLKDIMKIALPCIIVGDLGAWLIARQWLMSFSEKITMTPLLFIGVTIILLVIIGLSVIINCYKVANSNPVKYLKDE